MPETIIDLGKKVKAKYPGQYDDLSDDEVGRRVKGRFPGAYDDFADALAQKPKPRATDPRAKVGEFAMETVANIPGSAWNLVKGAAQAIAHPYETAKTIGQVGVGTMQHLSEALGNEVKPAPGWDFRPTAKAAGQALRDRYGSPRAIAETIKTDPVGALADVSTVAGGVAGAARGASALAAGARLPRVAARAGKVARTAAAVSEKTNPVLAAGKAASKIPIPERLTPRGLYNSSLKMPPVSVKPAERDAIVATGLRERIPVSRKGFDEAGKRIEDLNTEIAEKLAAKSDELGPAVSPVDVTKPVNRLKPTFANQVNPEADLAAINKSKKEFLQKHTTEAPYTKIEPSEELIAGGLGTFTSVGKGATKTKQPLTLAEAQAEKQGTYRQLRKKYGELGSADVEAQKALARGLKDEIVKRVPELAKLNAREGALIELEQQLARFVGREGNKNLLGLVPATLAHNPFGFIATLAFDNPAIKSRIAFALERAKRLRRPARAGARGLTAAGAIGNAADLPSPGPVQ